MNKSFSEKFRIEELLLFDFRYWAVSVRPQQPTIGSLIISLKRDCVELGKVTSDESSELSLVFFEVEKLLKKVFSFEKINYLCLMMVDSQVHFHAIPRYKGECLFDGNYYGDIFWPKPVDILYSINEANIEAKVFQYLKPLVGYVKRVVGYTTGVFDLFHIGHLRLLKRAKEECDYLIVGVTTDELSLNRKGKIPVIPLDERVEIVKNLSFVDEVVHQENMDKFEAWKKYRFDKMFVGSDWKGTNKWNQLEGEFAKENVKIVYFPYTDSTSSTLLRSVLNDIVR